MPRPLRRAGALLQRARNFAAGVLIGSAAATPVLAATDVTLDDLQTPVLLGSLVLLLLGLLLKVRRRRTAPPSPAVPKEVNEGIGRYRLQLGRGE